MNGNRSRAATGTDSAGLDGNGRDERAAVTGRPVLFLRPASLLRAAPRLAAAGAVRIYQIVVSPWLPPSCGFSPTCSEYARQALIRHGILRGTWLALRRLSRCHPFGSGGYDPVP